MYIMNVKSIDIDDKHYVIGVGDISDVEHIRVSRELYSIFVTLTNITSETPSNTVMLTPK